MIPSTEETLAPRPHLGWLVTFGIILLVLGVIALGATVATTLATVMFLGVVLLIAGVADIVSAFASRHWRGFGLPLIAGGLSAVLGLMLLFRPDIGAGVFTILLALILLASGLARILYSLAIRFPRWGWSLTSGIAAVALGVLVFAEFPTSAFWFLGVVVAIELLFRGAAWLAVASWVRRAWPRLAAPAGHAAAPAAI